MLDSMTEAQERMIDAACKMYSTATILHRENMITDANSIAAKARALLDESLIGLIPSVPENK